MTVYQNRTEHVFPSFEQVSQLLPDGRRPYLAVRLALLFEHGSCASETAAKVAIRQIAAADTQGTLEPPLTSELSAIVLAADAAYEDYKPTLGYHRDTARTILNLVFEHGYRSDSV